MSNEYKVSQAMHLARKMQWAGEVHAKNVADPDSTASLSASANEWVKAERALRDYLYSVIPEN